MRNAAVTVNVATIVLDSPPVASSEMIRYKVRLECGCTWWEYRAAQDGPPTIDIANCYAAHGTEFAARQDAPLHRLGA